MSKKPTIVIVGAGFAGINLAKNISSKDADVILLDRNNYHMFQPLLYQVATGGLEASNIAYPIRKIFRKKKGFEFRMTEVKKVEFDKNRIITPIGNIHYDYLVIATGSTNNFFGLDPIKDNFKSLKSVTQALEIRNTLMENLENLNVTYQDEIKDEIFNISIIGAGPAGVEIAGAIAEMKKNVLPKDFPTFDFTKMNIYLFEASSKVLAMMSPESSEAGLKYLEQLGVNVMLNSMVKDFDQHNVILDDGTKYKSKTAIWTAGVQAAPIAGFVKDELIAGKRIKVNDYNQSINYSNVFAIGDVSAHVTEEEPKGQPMLAQVAIQQGRLLGKNIIAHHRAQEMQSFEYDNKGIMATVGRNKAVAEIKKLKFKGFIAWFVWMAVHLMSLVGFRSKLMTLFDWTRSYFSYDRPLGAIIKSEDSIQHEPYV